MTPSRFLGALPRTACAVALLLLAACAATPPAAGPLAASARPARAAADAVTRQKLRAELAGVPGAAAFEMRIESQGLEIVLPARELFQPDTALLRGSAANLLDGWGRVLARHPRARITLSGHTDVIGRAAFNQEFSRQRAAAIAAALTAAGVSPAQVVVVGVGEAQPRSTQPGIAGREANRRVEMRVSLQGV